MYDPKDFACPDFASDHAPVFDKYVELRVIGYAAAHAVIEAFEMIKHGIKLDNASALGYACDINPYVRGKFKKALESKDVKRDMWSERMSVHKLLEFINDPTVRDATRLNAINALNVLCGYVSLDDATAKRVGHTLADFAKLEAGEWKAINGHDDARKVH